MGPRISVVVPMYDVEPYVAECLTSIALQSFRDLQVVVVDDGSHDDGAAVVQRFAEQDPRFILIQQQNAGPGGARNTGVRHADGEFLAFVDADDVLPANALAILHQSLARSGSDLATGVVRRFGGNATPRADLTPFRRTVPGTHITQLPEDLLVDRIVTNKLWRRTFWETEGMSFPEGVLYEDIPVALGGHVAAGAVDVLRDTVYGWRHRGPGSTSTTQDRAVLGRVEARLSAIRHVAADMARRGLHDLRRQYEDSVLALDLPMFIDAADRGDAAYRRSLVENVKEYLQEVDAAGVRRLPAIERLKYYFLERGMVEEMLETLAFQRQCMDESRTLRRRGVFYGDYPFHGDPSKAVPRDVYRLDTELQVRSHILSLAWSAKQLKIGGYAHIDRLSMPRPRSGKIRLFVRDERTGQETEVPVQRRAEPAATRIAAQANHCYDGAGFTAEFNPGPLFGAPVEESTLQVIVQVESGGTVRRSDEWVSPAGLSVEAAHRPFRAGHHLRVRLVHGQLAIDAHYPWVIVNDVQCLDEKLIVKGRLRNDVERPMLVARQRGGAAVVRRRVKLGPRREGKWRRFRVALPLTELALRSDLHNQPSAGPLDAGAHWQLRLSGADFTPVPLFVASPAPLTGMRVLQREFLPRVSPGGYLSLLERLPEPTVASIARGTDATLRLRGWHLETEQRLDLLLRGRRTGHVHRIADVVSGGSVDAKLPLSTLPALAGPRPLDDGIWDLRTALPGQENSIALKAAGSLIATFPVDVTHDSRCYSVRAGAGESLQIEAGPAARGNTTEQRRTTTTSRLMPTRDLVVFASWAGRRCGGDSRALYDQLRRDGGPPAVWVSRGGQIRPDGAETVESGSREHAELLARARWVVTDHLLPRFWRPRRGQRVLQTWHGTPVKRKGFALPPDAAAAAPLWLRELQRQALAWDLVLSTSPASTVVLQQTLRFSGDVMEAGAPRCDMVYRKDDAETLRAKLQSRLRIPRSGRVVLWVPTARDEGWSGRHTRRLGMTLPVPNGPEADDWTFLIHGHPALTEAATGAGAGWRDVSTYPNVHDLLLLADVLVTDYSSLSLDFLHTGRPIVLYTPDYAEPKASDHLAIDILGHPPGPVTRTTSEALEAILTATAWDPSYASAYEGLLQTYGGPRDGGAAERVLERLFE